MGHAWYDTKYEQFYYILNWIWDKNIIKSYIWEHTQDPQFNN